MNFTLNTNTIIALIAALCIGAMIAVIIVAISKGTKKRTHRDIQQEQLQAILSGLEEGEEELTEPKDSIIDKWFYNWGRLFQELSGAFSANDNKAGYFVIGIFVAVAAGIAVLVNNIFAGIVISAGFLVVLYIVLRIKANQKDAKIRVQLTGFLFALKAHISANETPDQAIMRVVDDMPKPLWEELIPLKNQILTGTTFIDSLKELRSQTTSDDLRFLCSCIIQAVSSGTSLERQIDKIREVVDTRKRITEEIAQATKSANTSLYIATALFPIGFIGTYMLDEQARSYWFVEPISWAMLLAAGALFGIGVYLARRFVRAVTKL